MGETGRPAAVELMQQGLTNEYPVAIKRQLWRQVRDLITEGLNDAVILDGLREWDTRPGLSPGILPHLVADAIRTRQNRQPKLKDWEAQLREEMGG